MRTLLHDGLLWISVAPNRNSKSWKNNEISWSDLVQRISKTDITHETHAEYMSFPKAVQDEKKDVGGFVGGMINGGRRKKNAVTNRYLITLDVDFGSMEFWTDFKKKFPNAAAIYGTHKHHPEIMPRFRLVMPLDREVFTDEYQAIARKIAELLGIDLFDPTTFQAERLMYWPSTPKDIEFYFKVQDGPFLSADAMLGLYSDWKDVSQWAVSSRAKSAITKAAEKQGEPTEKPGVIGAFNRVYTISEAIDTYLGEVYAPTDTDDRFTFLGGSTASGLVLYEDKFAYSHHGSDPCSGRLCNAFDLVRIQLFSRQDEDVEAGTPINKRPSHILMGELALKDKNVSRELAIAKVRELNEDFANLEPEQKDWAKGLKTDKKGNILPTTDNILYILKNDPDLAGCFAFNSFEKQESALRDLPWRNIRRSKEFLKDGDDAGLINHLEKRYDIYAVPKTNSAMSLHMLQNQFHPVRDYLLSVNWDGEARVDKLFVDYFGAADTIYSHKVTRKSIVACVARIFEPGIKFDTILTTVSPEGFGKSSFLKKLGRGWFSDDFGSLERMKEVQEQIQGSWIIEIAELSGLRKAAVEAIKHFTAKQEDRFRVAYGKRVEYFPRQCVFFGTTNKVDFLVSQEGNRRFWALMLGVDKATHSPFTDFTPGEVNQVWAEAYQLYLAGETLFLDAETEATARIIQEEHLEKDPREAAMVRYLTRLLPEDWALKSVYERREFYQDPTAVGSICRDKVSPIEIWCEQFGGVEKDASYFNTKFIRDYLNRLPEWEKRLIRTVHYGVQRGYIAREDTELL